MTTRQIASELTKQGHSVSVYVRKDGGILITRIDGKRFYGAEGNMRARAMLGETLSQARKHQTEQALRIRKSRKQNKEIIPKDMMRQINRINRKLRKRDDPKAKVQLGNVTRKKVRFKIQTEGLKLTREYLNEIERYAEGLAYAKNVELLIKMAEHQYNMTDDPNWKEVVNLLKKYASQIQEEWIGIIRYDVFDQVEKGKMDSKTALQNIKNLLEQKIKPKHTRSHTWANKRKNKKKK